MNRDDYDDIAARLEQYFEVPDDVLCELVTREGLCFWVFDRSEMPELSGEESVDRALAAYMCAGCPVIDECLELELRAAGANTMGVWGALSDVDRRVVYRIWQWRRRHRDEGVGQDDC